MNLKTPEKIRSLQRKLYGKAKAEPAFRFYILYDKICREDILGYAYALARENAGAPGVDGETFARIEASGVQAWLAALREDLVSKRYRPLPVRRVMIPKPGGGQRPLGIPTIRDRVAQTAANPRALTRGRFSRRISRTMLGAIDLSEARLTRSRTSPGICSGDTPTSWTPTRRSISTRYRTTR
jgi:hypothetical protein